LLCQKVSELLTLKNQLQQKLAVSLRPCTWPTFLFNLSWSFSLSRYIRLIFITYQFLLLSLVW
jgi:hypothetical protein